MLERLGVGLAIVALLLVGCDRLLLESGVGDREATPTRWFLAGDAGDNPFLITVVVGSSSCNELDDVVVSEVDGQVRVDATILTPTQDQDCTLDLSVQDVLVDLETPLGDRALLGCEPLPVEAADTDCRDISRTP